VALRLQALGHPKLAFILDEGTFIIGSLIPGVKKPVALIGNCEKGNINVKLTVNCYPPGHSSMPTSETNLGILSRAIQRLEARQQPPHIDGYFSSLRELGSHMPHWLRVSVFCYFIKQ
jgi:carboxypeptidase PM20D1